MQDYDQDFTQKRKREVAKNHGQEKKCRWIWSG